MGVRNPPLRKLRVTECYKGFWTFMNLMNTVLSSVTSCTWRKSSILDRHHR